MPVHVRSTAEPQAYDFSRPNRFSREHVRALQIVNDTFARQLATVLSTTLRTASQAGVASVTQMTYDEYVRRTPTPSLLAVLSLEPLPGAGVFQLPLGIAMGVIDRLLGGPGTGPQPERALSDIETGLLRELVQRIVHEFGYAFESLTRLQPEVLSLESDAQFMQLASPSEAVVLVSYDVRIGDDEAVASLCLPFSTVSPVLEQIRTPGGRAGRSGAEVRRFGDQVAAGMQTAPVDVTVRFAEVSLSPREILDLAVGDVLPLQHPVAAPLQVCAAGVPYAYAVPGSSGQRLACRVVEKTAAASAHSAPAPTVRTAP
jgi:flagellar motor switch protein FliM